MTCDDIVYTVQLTSKFTTCVVFLRVLFNFILFEALEYVIITPVTGH